MISGYVASKTHIDLYKRLQLTGASLWGFNVPTEDFQKLCLL